nr:hypothetical protein [Tanacetum cinerariifolium]
HGGGEAAAAAMVRVVRWCWQRLLPWQRLVVVLMVVLGGAWLLPCWWVWCRSRGVGGSWCGSGGGGSRVMDGGAARGGE